VTIPDRFAANVAWLFTEHRWRDRFAAAADAGFTAVEFPWPDDPAATLTAVRAAGLRVALLNMPAGNLAAGERGWPNDRARDGEWRAAFTDALELGTGLRCPTINVLAGNLLARHPIDDQLACLEENLRWALPRARDANVAIVSELLNRPENPDYLLTHVADAAPLLDRIGPLGWRLQLDTYHLGLTEPDVPAAIRHAAGRIGHVQVADVPGRHEPGTGALDWASIGAALADVGYRGSIGLEYVPTRPVTAIPEDLMRWGWDGGNAVVPWGG
jgi:hydroxypyruvate isomerase